MLRVHTDSRADRAGDAVGAAAELSVEAMADGWTRSTAGVLGKAMWASTSRTALLSSRAACGNSSAQAERAPTAAEFVPSGHGGRFQLHHELGEGEPGDTEQGPRGRDTGRAHPLAHNGRVLNERVDVGGVGVEPHEVRQA